MACRRPKRGLLRQAIHQASQSPGFADELLVQVWKNWKIMDDQKAAEGKAKDTQTRHTHTENMDNSDGKDDKNLPPSIYSSAGRRA